MRGSLSTSSPSQVLSKPPVIPQLDPYDVKLGKLLGEGVYGVVFAVAAFHDRSALQSIQQLEAQDDVYHHEHANLKCHSLSLSQSRAQAANPTNTTGGTFMHGMERRKAVVLGEHDAMMMDNDDEEDETNDEDDDDDDSISANEESERDDYLESFNSSWTSFREELSLIGIPGDDDDDDDILDPLDSHHDVTIVSKNRQNDSKTMFHEDTTTTAACDESENYDDLICGREMAPVSIPSCPNNNRKRSNSSSSSNRRAMLAKFRMGSSRRKHRHQEQHLQQQQQQHVQEGASSTRYVVKCIKKGLPWLEEASFAKELAKEAALLSAISHHPNICTLRATIGRPGSATFQILLDRLSMTLDDKLVLWNKQEGHRKIHHNSSGSNNYSNSMGHNSGGSSSHGRFLFRRLSSRSSTGNNSSSSTAVVETYGYSDHEDPLMCERLQALYDIAQALRFLHSHRIIYRDVKPANVGISARNHNYQLFDFGSARLVTNARRATHRVHDDNDDDELDALYHLTGLTGTRRYMAPEVARSDPYGFSADVYSFAILFWTVMTLHIPYNNFNSAAEHYAAVVERDERPDENILMLACPDLPYGLQQLLTVSWDACPSKRPSFLHICQCIEADYPGRRSTNSGSSVNMTPNRSHSDIHDAMNTSRLITI